MSAQRPKSLVAHEVVVVGGGQRCRGDGRGDRRGKPLVWRPSILYDLENGGACAIARDAGL